LRGSNSISHGNQYFSFSVSVRCFHSTVGGNANWNSRRSTVPPSSLVVLLTMGSTVSEVTPQV